MKTLREEAESAQQRYGAAGNLALTEFDELPENLKRAWEAVVAPFLAARGPETTTDATKEADYIWRPEHGGEPQKG